MFSFGGNSSVLVKKLKEDFFYEIQVAKGNPVYDLDFKLARKLRSGKIFLEFLVLFSLSFGPDAEKKSLF